MGFGPLVILDKAFRFGTGEGVNEEEEDLKPLARCRGETATFPQVQPLQ